jgi:GTPase involved in cell partitioning and DNA repair
MTKKNGGSHWYYPEGPGIVKSYDFPSPSGTYVGTELTNHIRRSVGLSFVPEWKPISHVQIVSEIRDLKRKLKKTETRLTELETVKIKEFVEKDVYEVNKRIERLERKIALLESSPQKNRQIIFVKLLATINILAILVIYGSKFL